VAGRPAGRSVEFHDHVLRASDERLEDKLRLHIAGLDPVAIGPGMAALAPGGIPHAYEVISPAPAHLLVACTGTSFARLVRDGRYRRSP
jgi:hypothetical protein